MADVKVQYWRKSNFLGNQKVGNNDEYDETVSVVKSGKVKKEQLQKLGNVMVNTGYKLSDSTATEFDVDWTQEPPVAKVVVELEPAPRGHRKAAAPPAVHWQRTAGVLFCDLFAFPERGVGAWADPAPARCPQPASRRP